MPPVAEPLTNARRLLGWGARAAVVAVLLGQCTHLTDPALLRPSDFVEYWSAGRLNLAGSNPYGPEELFPLQRDYGCPDDRPVMMYNPPWALPFVMPFGVLDYGTGRLAWLLLHFALVLFCADRAWRLLGGAPGRRWVAWGLSLTFFPTLIALRMGQIAPLMLAGLLGFLYFVRQSRGWLAGLALLPAMVKPQLFHLVWLALLLWAIHRRRWSVLLGAGVGLVAATGLALAPNPHALAQYAHVMADHPPAECLSPTLGAVLRAAFGRERFWLQFLPPLLGAAWLVPHWLRHRRAWDWQEQLPLLLLVSLLTTSYGAWAFDLVVLLLPVLGSAVALCRAGRRALTFGVLAGYLAVNALALGMNLCGVDGFWFLWMMPAALVAYLAVVRMTSPGWDRLRALAPSSSVNAV
jgi:hypothetical protein